jgi:hypothetical protein
VRVQRLLWLRSAFSITALVVALFPHPTIVATSLQQCNDFFLIASATFVSIASFEDPVQ